MNRRSFLLNSSLAACALATGSPASAAASLPGSSAPESKDAVSKVDGRLKGSSLKLSLAAYSFRDMLNSGKMSLDDFIDFCAAEGLDGTELTSYYFRKTDKAYLLHLRRRAYVNGLAITGTPVGNDFCVEPGPKRDAEIQKTKDWIDRVAILGSQTIRVFAGRVPKGSNEAESRARAIDGLKEVAEYASQKGVILGLENHGGITATADQLLALVEGVDSPWLGINLDSGNFHTDVYPSLARIAPYAVSVQVKITTRENGQKSIPTDYERLIGILRDGGYRGYVVLEHEDGRVPDLRADVSKHLEILRKSMA